MHPCLKLLEQALSLGEQELEYLRSDQVEGVEELSAQRFSLLDEAWERQSPDCLEEFREKFIQMQDLQTRLSQEAVRLHAFLRDELNKNRKESHRRQSYEQNASLSLYTQIPMLISRMG